MAIWKKALILVVIGTIVGWFLAFGPVETSDEATPDERRLME